MNNQNDVRPEAGETRAISAAAQSPSQARKGSKRRSASCVVIDLQNQLRALEVMRASLAVHHEILEDPELTIMLAEGQTSLFELMDAMLFADVCDEGLLEGLRLSKDTLAMRLHRLEERRQSRRAILEQAMCVLEVKCLERPTATLSLADRPRSLVVEEEAAIPTQFFDWKPVLNRRLTKEALEAGEDIPGAKLSNGTLTLTIRRH